MTATPTGPDDGATPGAASALSDLGPVGAMAAGGQVVAWASAFPVISAALEAFSPGTVAVARMLVASAAFLVAVPVLRPSVPNRSDLLRLAAGGFCGMSAYHVLLNEGQVEVTAATASLLISTMPLFTVLLSVVFLGERIGRRRWLGVAVAAVGMVLVAVGRDGGVAFEPEAIAVLAAALGAAMYTIISKPVLSRIPAIEATAWTTWLATLLLLPLAGDLPGAVSEASAGDLATLVWLGLVPSALGYGLYTVVLSRVPASVAVLGLYAVPPVAAAIAWVWLGEGVPLLTAAGGATGLLGVYLATRPDAPVAPTQSST